MLRNQIVCLTFLLALATAHGSSRASDFEMSQIYTIDSGHSYVGFQIKYMGFAKVRGRFSDVSGTIRYDDQDPTMTSATIRIGVESLDTDHDWRDKDLKSDQWFDAEAFPVMMFTSTRAVRTDAGFDLIGDLTIRDVTKEIRIVMEDFSGIIKDIRDDTQVIFVGRTEIDRKEFGVKGDRWSQVKEGITGVGSHVEIELTILGKQINAPNIRNSVKNVEQPQGAVYAAIESNGVTAGLAAFDAMLAEDPEKVNMGVLNTVGYVLLKEGRVDDAVKVFQHNCDSYPEAGDLYDSLGEAYAVQGDRKKARESYLIALESNPNNVNAIEILRHLE